MLNQASVRAMDIGEFIKARLKELQLSKAELARQVGVSKSAVGQWTKKDGTVPTGPHLVKAALVLKTTPEAFLDPSKAIGPAELEILALLRTMSPEGQKQALTVVRAIAAENPRNPPVSSAAE